MHIPEIYRQLFDAFSHTADGKYVFLNILDQDLSLWSKEAVEYFGLPGQEMRNAGAIWEEHLEPSQREAYHQNIMDLFSGRIDEHDLTYRARNRYGIFVTCSCKGMLIRDKNTGKPRIFAGTIVNHESEDSFDPVTGLYNSHHLVGVMQRFRQEKKPYYIMVTGIKDFHNLNDTYGYTTGNQLLKIAADKALHLGRLGMVFRMEGTKFAFVFDRKMYDLDYVNQCFEELRDYLSDVEIEGVHITADVRGGAILCDDFSIDVNAYYNSALFSLQHAKNQAENALCFFNRVFLDEQRKHLEILSVIRESILNDFAGFYLVYQPIVAPDTEKISGMEALLRWRNEKYGVVPPNSFIPWLETDAIFFELGNWIIRRAISDCAEILKENPDFTVNVNLAYPQLQRSDFNVRLNKILEETGFPPHNLKLELTERCKLLNMDKLRDEMVFFKSRGLQTSLDDFGTGYAALNLLITLPVDQIKIDKSFIDDIESDIPKQTLLEAVTNCARKLNMGVCAEGIERAETARFLRENYYITGFQGYYYSRPLEFADLLKWIEEHK